MRVNCSDAGQPLVGRLSSEIKMSNPEVKQATIPQVKKM